MKTTIITRKSGKWIVHEKPHGIRYLECPYCNTWYLNEHLIRNRFCPNCGHRLTESRKETEITEQWLELKETITEMRDNNGTGTQQEVCKFLANYMDVLEGQMVKTPSEEVHKSKILCPICEYKDSPFMPCNACDESGSEFKKGGKE